MNSLIEFFPMISLMLTFPIIVFLLFSIFRESKIETASKSIVSTDNLNAKVAPFIKIQEDFNAMVKDEKSLSEIIETAKRMESFRNRNKFYSE